MLKKSLNIMLLTSLFIGSSIFAEDIIVDKDSDAGKIILKSDKEYKEYLSKLVDNKSLENLLYKQECDINMLKAAVAKLIQNVNVILEDKKELESLKSKLNKIEENRDSIKNKLNIPIKSNDINNEKLENIGKVSNLIGQLEGEKIPVLKEKENKTSCVKVKKEYKESEISGSYIKYIPNKEFKVQTDILEEYEIPTINAKKTNSSYKKGDIIVADQYTKAGWVHLVNAGWVKGYFLFPKILQEDVKIVEVEECK